MTEFTTIQVTKELKDKLTEIKKREHMKYNDIIEGLLVNKGTDVDDVVIDPVAGSGTTLLASANCGRRAYGFEIDRNFYNGFYEKILPMAHIDMFDNAILEQQRQEKLNLKEKYGRKDNSR